MAGRSGFVIELSGEERVELERRVACYTPTEGGTMAKVINCECGEVLRADGDDELVQKVEREAHPDLVGKMSRDDILAMAEEA